MMGRNHLIAGSAIAATGLSSIFVLKELIPAEVSKPETELDLSAGAGAVWEQLRSSGFWWVSNPAQALWDWLMPHEGAALGVYLLIGLVLLQVGNLLPDIDSKSSLLGRYIHVPGPHRGITHTEWMLLGLFILSWPEPTRVLCFLWFGAWMHCEVDGLSRAGRVRFYPLSSHRVITLSGSTRCVVPQGYWKGYYTTGERSETVVLSVLVSACVVITAVSWFGYHSWL